MIGWRTCSAKKRLSALCPSTSALAFCRFLFDSDDSPVSFPARMPRHQDCRDRRRSRSPHGQDHKISKRSRSPFTEYDRRRRPSTRNVDRPQRISSESLPFKARVISKRDYVSYEAMFELYLDIQKHRVLQELPETEVKGRWKSFVGKWYKFSEHAHPSSSLQDCE